jgi:hypothetical protein
MAQGWSVAGRRVEFRAAFPAGKVVVLDGKEVVHEVKLASKGEWTVPVSGVSYRLTRRQAFLAPKTELLSASGAVIPMSATLVVPTRAPPEARCAGHQAAASYACARCGAFCCPACSGPDLTHCAACAQRLAEAAAKNAAAMAYFAPVPLFFVLGGPLAGLISAAAGAGAVAIARNSENRALKIGAAIGLYLGAFLVWLVLVALIMSAR